MSVNRIAARLERLERRHRPRKQIVVIREHLIPEVTTDPAVVAAEAEYRRLESLLNGPDDDRVRREIIGAGDRLNTARDAAADAYAATLQTDVDHLWVCYRVKPGPATLDPD